MIDSTKKIKIIGDPHINKKKLRNYIELLTLESVKEKS